jgi:hypothetical protein
LVVGSQGQNNFSKSESNGHYKKHAQSDKARVMALHTAAPRCTQQRRAQKSLKTSRVEVLKSFTIKTGEP